MSQLHSFSSIKDKRSCSPPHGVEHINQVIWASEDGTTPVAYAKHPKLIESDACGCNPGEDGSCCFDDTCILFATQEECGINCKGGEKCGNKRFQRQRWKSLVIRKTVNKGYGLFIEESCRKGEFVVEYAGVALDRYKFERSCLRDVSVNRSYIMTLTPNILIDASERGSLARYVNHSCDPNCVVDRWTVNGVVRLGIFGKRDIEQGEELTIDYGWRLDKGIVPTACYCGSEKCRGTLQVKDITQGSIKCNTGVTDIGRVQKVLKTGNCNTGRAAILLCLGCKSGDFNMQEVTEEWRMKKNYYSKLTKGPAINMCMGSINGPCSKMLHEEMGVTGFAYVCNNGRHYHERDIECSSWRCFSCYTGGSTKGGRTSRRRGGS